MVLNTTPGGEWQFRINIRQHLGDDTDDAAIARAATCILAEIANPGLPAQDQLHTVRACIEAARDSAEAGEPDAFRMFNDALDRLYDYGDDNSVWLGDRRAPDAPA